ncbi:MAG TPA: enoyl-CoA hydratase-related protein, partial [Gemmataceae bacterium]|nr:enoyl-CoA hydratase-related protein [Gemmataceae bacterium]
MPLFQTDNLTLETQGDQGAILSLHVAGRSLNVFTPQVLADLDAALDRLAEMPALRVLGIKSGKSSGFMAGADIQEFQKVQTAADAEALSATGQAVFNKLAASRVPTVAVIQGSCLGGGLEFALACDYRLVIDHPKTQLGLPEIELGLLPAWGGTQRLPRVIGIERALQVIVGRKRLKAREALSWGLADAVAANATDYSAEMRQLVQRALELGKSARRGWPVRSWRQRLLESTGLGRRLLLRGAERILRRRT